MKDQKSSPKKKNPPKRPRFSLQILAIVIIALASVFFFVWHQMNFRDVAPQGLPEQRSIGDRISVPDQTATPSLPRSSEPQTDSSATERNITIAPPAVPDANEVRNVAEQQPSTSEESGPPTDHQQGKTDAAAPSGSPALGPSETDVDSSSSAFSSLCQESARIIKDFYKHLDEQPYIKDYGLSTSSEAHFTSLIQKLLNNPPVVSGETNDLFTILQNTAHFFRIIGKDNILLIKAILDQEKDRYEYVLAEFYTLLHIPSCPAESFSLHVPPSSPYEYAGFFLSTMGGRLYLFRRDSMSRMVVSFYAILLIDEANRNASNKYGIEIAKAIDQIIEEMESTTYHLQLKSFYLDKLYDLKEQYQ